MGLSSKFKKIVISIISLLAFFITVSCSTPYIGKKDYGNFELGPEGALYHTVSAHEWIAGPDKSTSLADAKKWAENLNVDGDGWRLPTPFEIKTLYDIGEGTRNLTPLLKTSGWHVWTSKSDALYDYYFSFLAGRTIRSNRSPYIVNSNDLKRGFAVRLRLDRKYRDLEQKYSDLIKQADAIELNNNGIIHSKNGDFYAGIWFYEKAIEKNPDYYHAYFNRGKSYAIQGSYEKALSDFNVTININPIFSQAYAYRGMLFNEISKSNEAIISLNKAIEISPDNGFAYYSRAQFFYKKGEYEKAWKDVKKAQALKYQVKPNLIRALKIHIDEN